jgi:alkylhydroperoxidase/carboxymuconolactone decarboxylase family protein YurZ
VLAAGILQAFAGITVENLEAQADRFLRDSQHPTLGRAYLACGYAPMVELLGYLEADGFRNYIASGDRVPEPQVGRADGRLSSCWDDDVRLLVLFAGSDTAVRVTGSWVEGMIIATDDERLRRLVLHDEGCIQSMLGIRLSTNEAPALDPKTQALVRLGGLVALGAAPVSYHWAAEAALDAGATAEEVVGTLVAVAPISGLARVVSATPEVALAIGHDINQAFEELNAGIARLTR